MARAGCGCLLRGTVAQRPARSAHAGALAGRRSEKARPPHGACASGALPGGPPLWRRRHGSNWS
eukprot:1857471-Alexandrium_andersonii.AAC.1